MTLAHALDRADVVVQYEQRAGLCRLQIEGQEGAYDVLLVSERDSRLIVGWGGVGTLEEVQCYVDSAPGTFLPDAWWPYDTEAHQQIRED